MILVDANLLIYAIDRNSPDHRKARVWLEEILSDTRPIGLAWIAALAFLRVTTRKGVLRIPLSSEQAISYVDSWLELPHVALVGPGENHWAILRNLLQFCGTAGNLTSDAHLAALALEHGYTIYSADNDFRRFAGLAVINPLAN